MVRWARIRTGGQEVWKMLVLYELSPFHMQSQPYLSLYCSVSELLQLPLSWHL